MSKPIRVSAPGKLVLFGEHAVVQGKPCIVTSVDQRLSIEAEKLKEPILILNAPDVEISNYQKDIKDVGNGEIPKGAKFIEIALANFIKKHPISGGIKIATLSQFKSTFGFGSSSASAVCCVKVLSELFELTLDNKELFDIAYQTVLDIQGVGSGFDVASAIYGGTIYYVTPGKVIKTLRVSTLPFVVGYTGIKADTATLVRFVNKSAEKYPDIFKNIFDDIEEIVNLSKEAIEKEDLEKLGELMNLNQGFLETLGVSSDKLSALIYASRNAGAYGAKLSGAGGGDCMLALVSEDNKEAVEKAIQEAGGQVLNTNINAEGVRIE